MSPALATALTFGFIVFLFRRDIRERPNVTSALWLPFTWIFLNGSRFVSTWLNMFGFPVPGGSLEEGSPLDRLVFIALICGALNVLRKRNVTLGELVRNNRWLAIFLLYCLLAVLWSDDPFISLKRWIKVLGQPLMALVILTEPDPEEALVRVMKRCAYVLIPVSILFIKYFPQWGRGYEAWSGGVMFMGITANKNMLGADCFIFGFIFLWQLLKTWRLPKSKARWKELFLCLAFLYMIEWLLTSANSKTSLASLVVGSIVLLFAGWKHVNRRMIGTYLVVGAIVIVLLEETFEISTTVLYLLGRNPTLTERTFLWADLLTVDINPLFGAGFENFWMGERLAGITARQGWQPNQAHNGYLDTYLNLGLLGLSLLLAVIIATYGKARRELLQNFEFGRFRLGFLAATVAYNWTEAGFKTLHLVFFAFYTIAIDRPKRAEKRTRPVEVPQSQSGPSGPAPDVSDFAPERVRKGYATLTPRP